jgi:hypothetical protein
MGDPAELGNPYGAVGYNEWNGRDPEGLAGYFFDGTINDFLEIFCGIQN